MPEVGTQFAGYRIEGVVGRGGMGVVYRATELALDRPVALKLIAPELAGDDSFRERFLRESRLAASIDHAGILPVYAAGEADGELFLATRFVPGTDLRSLIDDGPLPGERAIGLVGQVADALDAAHERGLVHRDVKPGNVLVDRADHCYLCDFGLTTQRVDGGTTATGRLAGSLDYLAPEQIRRGEVDGRADQYALACVLYELLSGAPPFRRDTEPQTLWAHMQEEPASLLAYDELDPVFARALAKEPEERYEDCNAFADDARAALGLG
ncbi:MAG: serine/threonine-protein kinase, partial [Gaiellaceae bacterium]